MEGTMSEIRGFGPNWAPRNWGLCAGQLVAISQNQALFSLLGTTYGGDGRTTFGLPDLRGRTPIGQMRGPGLSDRRIGSRSGTETTILVQNNLPPHHHGLTGASVVSSGLSVDTSGLSTVVTGTADLTAATASATLKANSANASQSAPTAGATLAATAIPSGRSTTPAYGYNTAAPNTDLHSSHIALNGTAPVTGNGTLVGTASVSGSLGLGGNTDNTGASTAFNNMQPYLTISWIVCMQGVFPSRN